MITVKLQTLAYKLEHIVIKIDLDLLSLMLICAGN